MSGHTYGLGHNGGPTFDDIVRDNLERGLLLAIKEVIVQAVRDPRLERRHLRLLAEIIDVMNTKSGTAFPGRKLLAERSGYSEAGVAKAISELITFGYLVSAKRQASEGGRALAHYAIRKPTMEELQDQISAFIMAQRGGPKSSGWRPTWGADVTPVGNVTHGANVTPIGNVADANVTPVGNISFSDVTPIGNVTPDPKQADVTPVDRADVTPVVPTVTSTVTVNYYPPAPHDPAGGIVLTLEPTDEPEVDAATKRKLKAAERRAAINAALEAYNAAADQHGWSRVTAITEQRMVALSRRLESIGGVDRFKVALRGVTMDDFLMGRATPREGEKPFRLDLERLLSTRSGLGDVLARAIDAAENSATAKDNKGPWWKRPELLAEMTPDRWRLGISIHANGTWLTEKLGPPPGHRECVVPPQIVRELKLTEHYDERGIRKGAH